MRRMVMAGLIGTWLGCGGKSEVVAPPSDAGTLIDAGVDAGRDASGVLDVPDVLADVGPDLPPDLPPDVPPDLPPDPGPKPELYIEDSGVQGPFLWVRLLDDPNNESVKTCNTFNNPGADIDAVELIRGGTTLGFATEVVSAIDADPWKYGKICDNKTGDEQTALGKPDATPLAGSVSLNGGALLVSFGTGVALQSGDIIRVYEAAEDTGGIAESYRVYVGPSNDPAGGWKELGNGYTGLGTVPVTL